MKNKILIAVVLGILVSIIVVLYIARINQQKAVDSQAFLNTLKGEIVYECRNENIKDICTIDANGQNKKIAYHGSHPNNANISDPRWAENGTKIYFTAMSGGTKSEGGDWKRFSINPDGTSLTLLNNESVAIPPDPNLSNLKIEYEDGGKSIYYINNQGEKKKIYHTGNGGSGPKSGGLYIGSSPDKRYVIFIDSDGWTYSNIMVVNSDGTKIAKIIEGGTSADWKY